MSILSKIIDQLRSTGSSLEKQRILNSNKDSELLKRLFWMTENPALNYFVRLEPVKTSGSQELSLDILEDIKTKILGRLLTGNASREYFTGLLQSLCQEDADILVCMVNRDLDCKVGTVLVNKTWPNLIVGMPCMLASKMDEKIAASLDYSKGLICQKKYDGGRAMAMVDNVNGVTFLSRNGKPLELHGTFDELLSKYRGYVFDGELLVKTKDGTVENRQTGNGIYTRAVRGTISQEDADKFMYVVWDIVPIEKFFAGYDATPYRERLQHLIIITNEISSGRIELADGIHTTSKEKIDSFYDEMIQLGEEGAILKHPDSPWEDRRSKHMIKLKNESDIDAEVIGSMPHSKQPGWIGSLVCRTRDGKVEFNVGSGLTDDLRQKDPEYFLGKIVECKYNAIIKSKGSDIMSLFLPIFKQIRWDKTEANSLEELK